MHQCKRRFWVWAGLLPALAPLSARADSIDLPLVAGLGLGVGLPLLAFNVVVEALILARFIHVGFGQLWRPMLRANILSFLAGIPVTFINGIVLELILPQEMVARMGAYPAGLCVAALNYYLATVLVEYGSLRKRFRRDAPELLPRPFGRGLIVGNLASYAVLAPLFVWWAQPKHGVQTFTPDTAWAGQPAAQLLYVDPQNRLCSRQTDGSSPQCLLTNEVRDFVVSPDLKTILFRGASNHFFLARGSTVQRVTESPLHCRGQAMDFSPNGNLVALLGDTGKVLLWDGQSGHTQKIDAGSSNWPGGERVVWSTNENVFYLYCRDTFKITLQRTPEGALRSEVTPQPDCPTELVTHYARLGNSRYDEEDDERPGTTPVRFNKKCSLLLVPGLAPMISARCEPHRILICDNPGVFHFGRRLFTQASFLGSGAEILFTDEHHLYVADIPARKVGLLGPGKRFLLLTDFFSKAKDLEQELSIKTR